MREGYIPQEKRKKILLICDDIRVTSGVASIAREMVIGTCHHFNWVNVGGVMKHPEEGKRLDLSGETNTHAKINDSSIVLYPVSGYGDAKLIKHIINIEKPDALFIVTDPRYFAWLFQIEHEIRKRMPIIYLNIWDDLPYPMYNKSYYESCDALLAISKQTENINKVVLGDSAEEKIVKYCPHGINEDYFFPMKDGLDEFKNNLFRGKKYEFTILFNARNIHRKSISNLLLAYKKFIDNLPLDKAKECAIVLHTHGIDENGTNLFEVEEMIFGNDHRYNIIYSEGIYSIDMMRMLYNSCDVTALISSNEGWGLSLTESMMCGKMILANVTGGMVDQMRFEDEEGKWVNYTPEFPSNHFGKYKKCGEWALPVFPNNISLVGSVVTPYIYDDRVDFRDVAKSIHECYSLSKEERTHRGLKGREWVLSEESMMSAKNMCKNIIKGIDETFEKWVPRYKFELIQVQISNKPKHFTNLPIYEY